MVAENTRTRTTIPSSSGAGPSSNPNHPQQQTDQPQSSRRSWLPKPAPIVVHVKRRRPPSPPQPFYPGQTAHARPRGARKVYVPPRLNNNGGSGNGSSYAGETHEEDQRLVEGFSCYYNERRPGEYQAGGGSDWRPVELRDDENVQLPWDRPRSNTRTSEEAGVFDTPLHSNTVAAAGPADGGSGGSEGEQNLPPMVLQTMLKYDDEEFTSAANTVLEHIQWREVTEMDAKINAMMAESVAEDGEMSHEDDDAQQGVYLLAEQLGQEFIDGFISALDYRLDRLASSNESSNHQMRHPDQIEMDNLIMEVKRVVDKNASYFCCEGRRANREREQQHEHNDQPSTGTMSGLTGKESSQPQPRTPSSSQQFMPHANQSVAGFVPLLHTPRSQVEEVWTSKATSSTNGKADTAANDQQRQHDNKADRRISLMITKSFDNAASAVKSAYDNINKNIEGKIQNTLRSISRDEGDRQDIHDGNDVPDAANNIAPRPSNVSTVFREEPVAYGRYVEEDRHDDASGDGDYSSSNKSKSRKQSERRQEVVAEIQKLKSFMAKSSMHDEVQRSCQQRIDELRVELESMSLATSSSGEISPISIVSATGEREDEEARFPQQQQQEKRAAQRQSEDEDEKRDNLISKIERYELTLAKATNKTVRASCQRRLEKLQRDLAALDGFAVSPRSFESPSTIPHKRTSPPPLHVEPPTPQIIVQSEASVEELATERNMLAVEEPTIARDMQDRSMKRQEIVGEIKRVTAMLESTTVDSVRESCQARLEELRFDLKQLTPEDTPSIDASTSSYSSRDEHRLITKESSALSTYAEPPPPYGIDHTVKVMAPSNLPEGYKFSARLGNGNEFIATVPVGGVKKGEVFLSPLVLLDVPPTNSTEHDGHFKDGTLDCLTYGVYHPSFLNGLFCPQVALAQVQTRLRLTWQGIRGPSKDTFTRAVVFSAFVFVVNFVLVVIPLAINYNPGSSLSPVWLAVAMDGFIFCVYVMSVARTRRRFRTYYGIPETRCNGYEDECMATACSSCVVMQMLRSSADYDTYSARCFTDNGLSKRKRQSMPRSPALIEDDEIETRYSSMI